MSQPCTLTKRIFTITILLFFLSHKAHAQNDSTSSIDLQPIELQIYFNAQPTMSLSSSTQSISHKDISKQSALSFTSAINTVAGLRMEERSPGSYRIAMRGSLIRSPFGIRNTKVYMGEIPITDAGGNTYINLIDPNSISSMQIVKGPDGSIFGPNSGGIIQIQPKGFGSLENNLELNLSTGAYGLFSENISLQRKVNDGYQFAIDQSYTTSKGYREQSALQKKTFQTAHQWKYQTNAQLRLYALFTDLAYETPGGLTATQMEQNPAQARPQSGNAASAQDQKASIFNKTLIAGLTHDIALSKQLLHSLSIFGSSTDFENPFITNYEYRKENNYGVRTYFSWNEHKNSRINWQMQLGSEVYWGNNDRKNFGNDKGNPTDLLDKDKLENTQWNIFYRGMISIANKWNIEGSVGFNNNIIGFNEIYPIEEPKGTIHFKGIFIPRLASSFLIHPNLAIRASIAKGYSPPTLEEIRPSTRIINKNLQAEIGTNIESGIRYSLFSKRLLTDLTAYTYLMKNGIVRQLNDLGEDYYVNAGRMRQKGIEFSLWSNLWDNKKNAFLKRIDFQNAISYNQYRFEEYHIADKNYSKNKMTAVPDWTASNSLSLSFYKNINLHMNHYFCSAMPLDDANTVYSNSYHLLQAKLTTALISISKITTTLFVGADNLLNEKYSLGNDINAFGGRYFNPAPPINIYVGLKASLK